MKADIVDSIALTKASLTSALYFIDDLANSDTKITRQSLKNIVDYLKVVALEQAEKSPVEYRDDFVKIVHQMTNSTSPARSGSKSKSLLRLTNGSATRKNMTGGNGHGKGFQLARFKKQPGKFNKAIVLTRKAGKAVAGAFGSAMDFLRIDQQTRNYLRRLGKIQERALARGNLEKADELQIRISEIREVYELFPSAPLPVIVALILYSVYKTPTWTYATTRTAAGIGIALPLASAAAASGKTADLAASGISTVGGWAANGASWATGSKVSNPLDFGTTDMAMEWANSTGRETNRLVGGVIDASIPAEATEFGHMMGFFIFTPLLGFAALRWNAQVKKIRDEARQRRLGAQSRLKEMLDEKERKLLKNVQQNSEEDNDGADKTEIETEMNTILTYFGLTQEEKEKNLQELQTIVKTKYQERIRTEHPNRGGRAENFDRTKQMYDDFKDLIIRLT